MNNRKLHLTLPPPGFKISIHLLIFSSLMASLGPSDVPDVLQSAGVKDQDPAASENINWTKYKPFSFSLLGTFPY